MSLQPGRKIQKVIRLGSHPFSEKRILQDKYVYAEVEANLQCLNQVLQKGTVLRLNQKQMAIPRESHLRKKPNSISRLMEQDMSPSKTITMYSIIFYTIFI